MPSLFRFLIVLALIAGVIFGGMLALVAFIHPEPREISQTIAPQRLNK
ncbi:histidine kinase [Methylocella silvestris]|uniref:Histidine kinase n=1 Tax=Methylocella silvestris TaxID=199596 RepID=A0A2J7TIU6_METSI|nr:histidine kinase [Methylocella silvestris]PNG26694.1 histidine kinase [Methylocella silvestris]